MHLLISSLGFLMNRNKSFFFDILCSVFVGSQSTRVKNFFNARQVKHPDSAKPNLFLYFGFTPKRIKCCGGDCFPKYFTKATQRHTQKYRISDKLEPKNMNPTAKPILFERLNFVVGKYIPNF